MTQVTVGVDIGTTSVKAVAADEAGGVVARARVPHDLESPAPDQLQHRPDQAWRSGVAAALDDVAAGLDVAAVQVAAMVPSLCAVDTAGRALTPGLLYGDGRSGLTGGGADPSESGELVGFLEWCAREAPDATGFWPAQAMATHALCGEAVIDPVVAMTTVPLFDYQGWDPGVATAAGVEVAQLPRIVPSQEPAGEVRDGAAAGAVVGSGTIDAFAEQLVAGADRDGDVLVICGATLITWAVLPEWREVPGLWTVPHTAPGKTLIGGASAAGGLFVDWARRLLGDDASSHEPAFGAVDGLDPARVPVWTPYVRGERTPLHDRTRRAAVHDLDLTHDRRALARAVFEAAGFVVRHHLDLAGISPSRLVVTGGGSRSGPWVQALADCTGAPADTVAVPEGGALGAAFLARGLAGLDPPGESAERWVRVGRRVEPDPVWAASAAERYERFRSLTDRPGG